MGNRQNKKLPSWEQMSDLDRGCALLHLWKVDYEGRSYATENYPARYQDDPVLVALSDKDSCRHARRVGGSYDDAIATIGADEVDRLYELALRSER